MDDLISRQDAINAMIMLGVKRAVAVLESLPSVEPKRKMSKCTKTNCPIQMNYISNDCDIKTCPYRTEQKKGEWIYDSIRGRFPVCKCSICGHYENADWALLQGANYCPNCGADMRGE